MEWLELKIFVTQAGGVSRDALHILAGVAVHFLAAALLRVPISRLAPFLVVVAAALGNEWFDLRHEVWPERARQWGESGKDILVTLATPAALLMLARFAPGLLVGKKKD